MRDEDPSSNGADRLRRPIPERTEPFRGFSHLYTQGRPVAPAASDAPPADTRPLEGPERAVRDGYRVVEENLNRGRKAAAGFRGLGREARDFAARLEPQKLASNLAQALVDPALTQQVADAARAFMGLLGDKLGSEPAEAKAPAQRATTPLHPQERSEYSAQSQKGKPRVVWLEPAGENEWLGEVEIDGRSRRVRVRALDQEPDGE